MHNVPLLTTLSAAAAAVNGITALKAKDRKVRSLQQHFRSLIQNQQIKNNPFGG
jgi:hypothetical protein